MDKKTKKYIVIGGLAVLGIAIVGFTAEHVIKKIKYKGGGADEEKVEKKMKGKAVSFLSEGYVTVRSSPKIDDENWLRLDVTTNMITKAKSNPVGTILKRVKGEDGYYWFKINLSKPVDGKAEGYVREDAVEVEY